MAKGKLDTNVLGVALGVPLEKVSTGPFGQFQNCGDDEDSLTKLVIQLLQRNPDASPREEAVRMQVRVFLEGIKTLISSKGKPARAESDESNVAKLFEEVKVMVRELPARVDDRVGSVSKRGGMKRFRKFHPMMFEELLFHPALRESSNGPAAAWLLFMSVFRDDIPWLYEMGLDLYQALRSRDADLIKSARTDLLAILEATTRGPFFHGMLRPEDEEIYFLVRQIPEMIDRFLAPILDRDEQHLRKRVAVRRPPPPSPPKEA